VTDRDIGPPERHRKGDKIVELEVMREDRAGYKSKAGEVVAFNATECSLDVMWERGHLGPEKDAKRRRDAGWWLRELYLRLHGSIGVQGYHDAWSKFSDVASNMSEADSWNFKVMMDTQRTLKHHWRPLECVCILDRRYSQAWPALHTALDLLADHRGI